MFVELITVYVSELACFGKLMVAKGCPYRVKNVALGSGLTTIAMSNIRLASEALKLRAADSPSMIVFRVMFLPSWGRKPWFASVFIMGQGPRTETDQQLHKQEFRHLPSYSRLPQRASIAHSEGWQRPEPMSV